MNQTKCRKERRDGVRLQFLYASDLIQEMMDGDAFKGFVAFESCTAAVDRQAVGRLPSSGACHV